MSLFRVAEMHEKFGFKPRQSPGFLPPEIMAMRLNFLLEELLETADACGYMLMVQDRTSHPAKTAFVESHNHVNLEEALDGLLDLEIVLHGTAHLMGFNSHIPKTTSSRYATIWSEAEERVYSANMAKCRVPAGQVGKRGTSHDLIKPEGWKAPTFKDLLP